MLFNQETIYLHNVRRALPDKVMEGDSGWVLQAVLSRASFRRQPPNGQNFYSPVAARQYLSCQETRHRKEAYPYDSCSDA